MSTLSSGEATRLSARSALTLGLTIVVIEFISGFTQGYYEPLIPEFGTTLGIDASTLTLFNVIPLAVAALFVPILTKLGDIHGYRKLLRLVVSIVAVATVVIWAGAVTGSWGLVLLGRLLNGPIAVWLPLHIALVHAKESGQGATRWVSLIMASLTFGTVIGTASSGFIHQVAGSLANSLLIVPVLQVVAVILVWAVMPEFVSGAPDHIDRRGFTLLGIVMVLAIAGFVTVVSGGLTSVIGAGSLIIAVAVFLLFIRVERRTEHPAVDVTVLFSRNLGPLYIAAIAFGAVLYGYVSPLATFLAANPETDGYGFAFSAPLISLTQTAMVITMVVAALILPALVRRIGERASTVAGFSSAALGFLEWTLLPKSIPTLVVFSLLVGLGLGLIQAVIPVVIPDRAPRGTHGIALGLYNSAQTLGGALGGGLFLSLLTVGRSSAGQITTTGYSTVWATSGIILLLGLIAVVVLLNSDAKAAESLAHLEEPSESETPDLVDARPQS